MHISEEQRFVEQITQTVQYLITHTVRNAPIHDIGEHGNTLQNSS